MARVLQINDYPSGGGAEVVVTRTTELLRSAGWDVGVFTVADLDDPRRTPRRYINNPVARRCLAVRLSELQPDVVHLHNFYHCLSPGILAELAAHKRRRPTRVVMTAHDCHLVCPDAGGTWFRAWSAARRPVEPGKLKSWSYLLTRSWDQRGLAYSLMKLAQHFWNYRLRDRRRVLDTVICPSRFLADLVADAGQPTIHLPNPTPCALSQSRSRSGPLRFAFVGRLEPEKGVRELLDIWPADYPATLTIIGDGREAPHCRAVCRRRGLDRTVEFLGRLPHAEVLALMGQFHILVLPSLFLEPYGICVVEALSAGTNVLVSDRGAPKELVAASGTGFVFRPGDAGSLAEQLARIARSHAAATLNNFDASHFLEERSEAAYLQGLLRVYQHRAAA
jgi:glycosyltransferase involved in cell wall biosynthesis